MRVVFICVFFVLPAFLYASADDQLSMTIGDSRIDVRWDLSASEDFAIETLYAIVEIVAKNRDHIGSQSIHYRFHAVRQGDVLSVSHGALPSMTGSFIVPSVDDAIDRMVAILTDAYDLPQATGPLPPLVMIAIPAALFETGEPDIDRPHLYYGPAPGTMQAFYRGDLYLQYFYFDAGAVSAFLDRYPAMSMIVIKRELDRGTLGRMADISLPTRRP